MEDGSMNTSRNDTVVRWGRCLVNWINGERDVWRGGQGSSKKVNEFKK